MLKMIWKVLFQLKNVRSEYEQLKEEKRPFYLSRRFIGAVLIAISFIIAYITGTQIDNTIIEQVTDNIVIVIEAVIAIWGTVMVIVGYFKRKN